MSMRWWWTGLGMAALGACGGSLREESVPFRFADCYVYASISGTRGQAWETDAGPGSELLTVTPWEFDNTKTEGRASQELKQATRGRYCHATLLIDEQTPDGEAFSSWQRVRAEEWTTTVHSMPHYAPIKSSAGAVSGRLPPELIQGIVRAHFGDFRICYEKGLGRNPQLGGKIQTRFVIERDGTVSNVSDAGSEMPDEEVRNCVIDSFKRYRFPNPEGGVVTVVYPILLAPG